MRLFTAQVLVTLALLAAGTARADSIAFQFSGLKQSAPGSGVIPPDTMGSVGPNFFFETLNSQFQAYSTSTGAAVGPALTNAQFWQNAGISSTVTNSGNGLSDPRVIYDPSSQRWFAAEINTSSTGNQLLLGRSDTADPTGTWKAVNFTANAGFGDQPLLSLDAKGVNVGLNDFTSSTGTFTGVSVWNVPKSDLLQASPSAANRTGFQNLTTGIGVSPDGALNLGASPTQSNLFSETNSGRTLVYNEITGAGGAGAALSSGIGISIASGFGNTFAARQPGDISGATLDTGDPRFNTTPVEIGNLVYLTHTVGSSAGGNHDVIDWEIVDISNPNAPVLVREGQISNPNFDYYYPSIAANANGDFVIGFNGSGSQAGIGNISAYYEVCHSNGLQCSGPLLITQSSVSEYNQTFGGPSNRWGDYSATILDPVNPNVFWTVQEVPLLGNQWGTEIAEINTATAPEPSTISVILLAGLGLRSLRRRLRRG
jgi:hypothetical protein